MVTRDAKSIRETFEKFVLPTYARFDLVLVRGEGSSVFAADGKRYLDMGGGIAVCALGHAHRELADTIAQQARTLTHVSNLYYNEQQGRLAEALVNLIAPGRVFFCNSGAEANEGLFKLARKFGHQGAAARDRPSLESGRYQIITTHGSFHGRTLAGIAATGQEKVKKGFAPPVEGFKHVPFNDLEATRAAITAQTAAILVEPVQGESGITIATPEYLLSLRKLCDEQDLLLLFDEVQAGHFRTGPFHSWQRIVGHASGLPPSNRKRDARATFLPDAISMAKSMGNGFPIGAFWVREKYAEVLGPGTHASTFGGTPLACAVALKVLEIIQRDRLDENAREIGEFLMTRLQALCEEFPNVIREVRGFGLMIGIEFNPKFGAVEIVKQLHKKNLLTVPAATSVIRLLPPLNLSRAEAEEGLQAIAALVQELA